MSERAFKVGDVIRITDAATEAPDFYFTGDLATIIHDDADYFMADFSLHDNDQVIDDGRWWIGTGRHDKYEGYVMFELVTAAQEVQE